MTALSKTTRNQARYATPHVPWTGSTRFINTIHDAYTPRPLQTQSSIDVYSPLEKVYTHARTRTHTRTSTSIDVKPNRQDRPDAIACNHRSCNHRHGVNVCLLGVVLSRDHPTRLIHRVDGEYEGSTIIIRPARLTRRYSWVGKLGGGSIHARGSHQSSNMRKSKSTPTMIQKSLPAQRPHP